MKGGIARSTCLDLAVNSLLLVIKLIVVVGIHLKVVEGKLLLDALLEGHSLLQGQGVGLGNDGHDVDDIRKLLQHDDINWLQGVARRLDEEQAAVDAGILDVPFTLGGELFSEVGRVLVFDVLDDRIPAFQS